MYLFYIDEAGNLDPQVQGTRQDGSTYEKDWLYVLTAIGMFEHNWHKFYFPIVELKRRLIDDIKKRSNIKIDLHQCEIKSNWVRIPKERSEHIFLSQLSEDELKQLIELYYSQFENAKCVIISAVIDKRHLVDYFDQTKLHRKAWELLCERIENFMREHHYKHRAVLITDDVSQQANASLASKHAYFLEHGTSARLFLKRIVELPLFVRSDLSEGIQLADLCAYNVYHAIKYNKPEYDFFLRIRPRFYSSINTSPNKTDGFKVFPDTSPLTGWLDTKK
jgi:hypothetical protein